MSTVRKHLSDEGSKEEAVVAGGIAGLVSRFCIAPLDILKIRLQLQTHRIAPLAINAHGIGKTAKRILREEGITGFWRGNLSAELLYVGYGAIQFGTYQTVSTAMSTLPLPTPVSTFIAGAVAGATATTLTYPLDLLRTRFAAQGTTRVYTGFLRSFVYIARTEKLRGFFQGLSAGVVQIVPHMGLFFAFYEGIRPHTHTLELPLGSGDAIAGVLASIVAKTGVFPLDLIRKRLQVQGPERSKFAQGAVPEYASGVLRTGKAILSREGWRGLYRGLGIGLVKAAPASAITVWTFEQSLRALKRIRQL